MLERSNFWEELKFSVSKYRGWSDAIATSVKDKPCSMEIRFTNALTFLIWLCFCCKMNSNSFPYIIMIMIYDVGKILNCHHYSDVIRIIIRFVSVPMSFGDLVLLYPFLMSSALLGGKALVFFLCIFALWQKIIWVFALWLLMGNDSCMRLRIITFTENWFF